MQQRFKKQDKKPVNIPKNENLNKDFKIKSKNSLNKGEKHQRTFATSDVDYTRHIDNN